MRSPEPLVPLPTQRLIHPPRPAVLLSEPVTRIPEFPDTLDPELKTSRPLPPLVPLFVDITLIDPLLVAVPSPDSTVVDPPLHVPLRPDGTASTPPTPLVPLPTHIRREPPRPVVPAQDPTFTMPLFPVLADPELKDSQPLDPAAPLFRAPMDIAPLLVPFPCPPCSSKSPPDAMLLADAMRIALLVPLVPLPLLIITLPPRPPDADPEASITTPLFPSFTEPVLKTRCPLVPVTPEFPLRIIKLPLLVAELSPEVTIAIPPLRPMLRPERY